MHKQTYIDADADLSDEMRLLAEELARGRCDMITEHGRNHISFYNEGDEVWPDHFRIVNEHGGRVVYAGRKGLPAGSDEPPSVVFARHDVVEGRERGWMEIKLD